MRFFSPAFIMTKIALLFTWEVREKKIDGFGSKKVMSLFTGIFLWMVRVRDAFATLVNACKDSFENM